MDIKLFADLRVNAGTKVCDWIGWLYIQKEHITHDAFGLELGDEVVDIKDSVWFHTELRGVSRKHWALVLQGPRVMSCALSVRPGTRRRHGCGSDLVVGQDSVSLPRDIERKEREAQARFSASKVGGSVVRTGSSKVRLVRDGCECAAPLVDSLCSWAWNRGVES